MIKKNTFVNTKLPVAIISSVARRVPRRITAGGFNPLSSSSSISFDQPPFAVSAKGFRTVFCLDDVARLPDYKQISFLRDYKNTKLTYV